MAKICQKLLMVVPIIPGGLNWLDLVGMRLDLCRGQQSKLGPSGVQRWFKLGYTWLFDGPNQPWCTQLAKSGWFEVGSVQRTSRLTSLDILLLQKCPNLGPMGSKSGPNYAKNGYLVLSITPGALNWLDLIGSRLDRCRRHQDQPVWIFCRSTKVSLEH